MSALLPLPLRNLGATLPLPDPQSVRLLARHELLSAWCQRRLLEELAGVDLPPEAGEDPSLPPLEDNHTQLLAYARRCGVDSLEDLETWRRTRGLSLLELEQLVAFENSLARASHWIWIPRSRARSRAAPWLAWFAWVAWGMCAASGCESPARAGP